MTNIPYESKGIILLFSNINFMISDLNFERFSIVSLFPFYVHCIYTEENPKQVILTCFTKLISVQSSVSEYD